MSGTNTKIEVLGAKDAVRALNKIEPGLRKQFAVEATEIAQPAISEAQNRYSTIGVPLSGMNRAWSVNGRKLFPYNVTKAQKGLKIKVEGDRRRTAVILLEQRDPAAAIFESAGRANANRLGTSLGELKPGRTRVLGPALFKMRDQVSQRMEKAVLAVVNRVNRELQ